MRESSMMLRQRYSVGREDQPLQTKLQLSRDFVSSVRRSMMRSVSS